MLVPSTVLVALVAVVEAQYYRGFNVAASAPDGSCRTQQQWEATFQRLQQLPQDFNSVRLYSSSDCNILANAVPAALNTNTGLFAGIWADPPEHYALEKAALASAISTYGSNWLLAVSVGSEDLFRRQADPNDVAGLINDIRGMLSGMGVSAPVGHVDTVGSWVDTANTPVITASDFIGMTAYPYFTQMPIDEADQSFWGAMTATQSAVQAVSYGKPVWIAETGWPVSGASLGPATASTDNARMFWNTTGCKALQSANTFWYMDQDYEASPSFGVFDSSGNILYDIDGC